MRKRTFLAIAVAGLLASLAWPTASHAAPMYTISVSEAVTLIGTPATFNTISSVAVDYSGLGGSLFNASFSGAAYALGATTPTPTMTSVVGSPADGVKVAATSPVFILSGTISFETIQSTNNVTILAADIKAVSETVVTSTSSATYGPLTFTVLSVPEPTSMALLGVGMTAFIAFRKYFKRGSIV